MGLSKAICTPACRAAYNPAPENALFNPNTGKCATFASIQSSLIVALYQKVIISAISLLAGICYIPEAAGQTFVSTLPQPKNAVLEVYGGIYCVYCPEGNAIAEQLVEDHPDDVVLINIHAGSYAIPEPGDPDLRSDYGEALKDQTGLSGYPAGTVNRRVFPGLEQNAPGTTAINRGNWSAAVESLIQQISPVNIAAIAHIDVPSGLLTIQLEIYYTASSNSPTNKLNIALLQSRIYGAQLGYLGAGDYAHQYILRDLLTGQWGETIANTQAGHFESRTYTYPLPPEFRNVPVDPADLHLAIFIAEGQQQILNGIALTPTYTVANAVDAHALELKTPAVVCADDIMPVLTLRNDGNQPLTSVDIQYSINGETPALLQWTGHLTTFQRKEITLPALPFQPAIQGSNVVVVSLFSPNDSADDNIANNTRTITFDNASETDMNEVSLEIKTDYYGYETYWQIIDDQNNTIAEGGNNVVGAAGVGGLNNALPSDPGALGNNQFYTFDISLPAQGCYMLRVLDAYGDGMCCNYGGGFFRLRDQLGQSMLAGGIFGAEETKPFRFGELIYTATAEAFSSDDAPMMYPNPAKTPEWTVEFNLQEAGLVEGILYSATGARVWHSALMNVGAGKQLIPIYIQKALSPGLYWMEWHTADKRWMQKLILQGP